tara:strand:- start:5413 stop:7359 length:1947 start_codon:yes stop_codon:yes gene_type:complete
MTRYLKILGILFLLYLVLAFIGQKVGILFSALTPPTLPETALIEDADWDSQQNWTDEVSEEFHFKTQGSRTLNIPLSWFLALEAPTNSPIGALFFEEDRFSAEYLTRFGFIPSDKSANNPDGLPIGIAVTHYQQLAGLDGSQSAVGFTCAACHTGQLVFEGKRYVINGGTAMVDLGQLTKALGAALGQTAVASKLPILDGRFQRFASSVLGEEADALTIDKLRTNLGNVVGHLAAQPMGIDVTEGFSRLDALNRIGNQVFATDPDRPENYVSLNSPVNFPPIWTASWFNWVQYDGSIMSPLIRNMGEAMGTAGHIEFQVPVNEGRYSSSIPVPNLNWIEHQLAGPKPPLPGRAFTGLQAPRWPEAFPAIDQTKAESGEKLYAEVCAGCHRPALSRAVATGLDPDNKFWQHFKPIEWWDNNKKLQTQMQYLDVNIIPQSEMGTDPGQGRVLAERTVNTSALNTAASKQKGFGINTRVCTPLNGQLETVNINDDPLLNFGLGLGAAVQMGINKWQEDSFVAHNTQDQPNCLEAGKGYKARPLNGIWSTGPFLHNGSVPTLAHLLGPANERPDAFLLGNPEFDPVNVGIQVIAEPTNGADYSPEGYFVLRTSIPGNSNRGHEFADKKGPGVIGRGLSKAERDNLIEFLKTI